jgi:hypothetical protein
MSEELGTELADCRTSGIKAPNERVELDATCMSGLFTGAAVKIRTGRPELSHEEAERNANYGKSQRFEGSCKPQVDSLLGRNITAITARE